jgi:hypothetical protein
MLSSSVLHINPFCGSRNKILFSFNSFLSVFRLNTFRSYMNTGGYIGATYFTVGNYKFDAYVAADFATIFITLVTQ